MVCEKDPAVKNRCHIRYMHLFSTVKYKVSISVSNALGHNATAITFDEFTIGAWGLRGGRGSLLHPAVGVCKWMFARSVYEHAWGCSRVSAQVCVECITCTSTHGMYTPVNI